MIDSIYISHCEKLYDRLDYIDSVLSHPLLYNKTKIISFTEEDDKKNLENSSYYKDTLWKNDLKDTEIFIAEQMFFIYEDIVKNGFKNTLILEDDFVFSENFDRKYKLYFDSLPDDYDCVFMSSCDILNVPKNYNNLFWESEKSRCTCAYLVSLNFCEKMTSNKKYFSPIDWHLNFIKSELNFKYYWTKDILFNQGSETKYKSNIR